ncbi:MAG: hypothetical protein ABI162_10220 [Luteolibacter sp.]
MKSLIHAVLFPLSAMALLAQDAEPQDFPLAMDLFQARKYAEARTKFTEVKEDSKESGTQPDSPFALAGFYEMECFRKLGDLDGLARALEKFPKSSVTREWQLRQLELDGIWDTVRLKDWGRVESLVKEQPTLRLAAGQRAQIAYCQGLAQESLNRPEEALFAYNTAMTADGGASEEIVRLAALHILSIHLADPEVRDAIKLWGTPAEDKASKGFLHLKEAAAVATLFRLSLGNAVSLPAEFAELSKYGPGR